MDATHNGYKYIYHMYNVTPDQVWSIPGNFVPLTNANETVVSSGAFGTFPAYENGGSFFHSAGMEIAAQGHHGRAAAAWNTFQRFMNNGYCVLDVAEAEEVQVEWGYVLIFFGKMYPCF